MNRQLSIFLGIFCSCLACHAATRSWQAVDTNDWFVGANWGGTVPQPDDDVIITNAGAFVLLTNSTPHLKTIYLSRTLICSNWTTCIEADAVTVASNGRLTIADAYTNDCMSNRVWIIATGLVVEANARIDADYRGYLGGVSNDGWKAQGPGAPGGGAVGAGCGGGHGGRGGDTGATAPNDYAGDTYDLTNTPFMPGSGGGGYSSSAGGHGGGAILLDVTNGAATVHGTITANGQNGTYGGGSGGSVWIKCQTLRGSTGGLISAKGGNTSGRSGMGGGGRIAVVYDPGAQSNAGNPGVRFDVGPGAGLMASTEKWGQVGELGSIYFPDTQLLSSQISGMNGRLHGFSDWRIASLSISNSWIEFGDSIGVYVTNDTMIDNGRLGGNLITCGGDMAITNSRLILQSGCWKRIGNSNTHSYRDYGTNPPPQLAVGGDVTVVGSNVTNNAIYVYPVATNSTWTNYGAAVSIAGSLRIMTNAAVFPFTEMKMTNGGTVLFQVGNLYIEPGGRIDGVGRGNRGGMQAGGYRDGTGPGRGLGAGGRGGGYGGTGGCATPSSGLTYGDSNAPVQAGSGGGLGGTSAWAGDGGSAVRFQVGNLIDIRGIIDVRGTGSADNPAGGGSGGAIYLRCRKVVARDAEFNAAGGNGSALGGGGGGGRIAVWSVYDDVAALNMTVAGGTGLTNGQAGTIVWGQLPPMSGGVVAIR